MFAAAATIAQMAFDASLMVAQWLATRVFALALIAIVLPWVLKGIVVYFFDWFTTYGLSILDWMMTAISSATGGQVQVDIHLTGVGGYLAVQTGLLDYASIIFSGMALYWVVAVLAKTPRMIT